MIFKLKLDAFLVTDESKQAIEQAKQDRRLNRCQINVMSGGLKTAPTYYSERETPDVLVVEEDCDDNKMMRFLGDLAEVCSPNTRVVVVGTLNDINLYKTLVEQGVVEYLLSPLTVEKLFSTLENAFNDPEATPKGKLITFYGARGGVGSSTLAHNIAWQMSQIKKDDEVAVIDADILFGTASLSYNIDPKQTIYDALTQPSRLDHDLLDKFMVRYDERFMILGAPGNFNNMPNITLEAMESLLDLVREMASQIVLDLPHTWAPWVQQLLIDSDETIVVATPDLTCFRNVKNINDLVGKARGKEAPIKLVFNLFNAFKKSQLAPKDFGETLGVEVFEQFEFMPDLYGVAANNGQMIGEYNDKHPEVIKMKDLASKLSGWSYEKEEEQGIAGLLERLMTPFDKK